jgi:hypothetical protein
MAQPRVSPELTQGLPPTGTLHKTMFRTLSSPNKIPKNPKTVRLVKRNTTRSSTESTPEIPTAKKYNMVRTLHPNLFM